MNRFYYIIIIALIASCKQDVAKTVNSPIQGTADIWCDENLKYIISQQEDVFESAYNLANVNIHYEPELVAKRKFYADSIDVMILSHGLDSSEIKAFNKRKVFPQQYMFGKSALAFVSNPIRAKKDYTYEEMIELLSSNNKNQIFAIESGNSGIALNLKKYLNGMELSKNVYALASKDAVIDWLMKNPNGIGIIDWSNIADEDDSKALDFLSKLSLIRIGRKDASKDKNFYEPYQHNLNGLYPFTRDLYIIRKLGLTDVSLGFASFVCEQRGQTLMLKSGLLPQYQSERWIEFKGLKSVNVIKD